MTVLFTTLVAICSRLLSCASARSVTLLLPAALLLPCSGKTAETLTVYPQNSSLEAGGTRQFTAYVPLTNTAVEWLVNDVVGGDPQTTGKITTAGLYTPPPTIPSPNSVTIKVRSIATPSAIGTTSLTLTRKYPWLWSTSPASVSVGTFQITLNGANYAGDSQVLINGVPVATTCVSPTSLKATASAAAVGTLQVSVRNPGNGALTGNGVTLTVTGVQVKVAVSPVTTSVQLGVSQSFTSSVSGTTNTAVTWSVLSGGGTVSSTGVYTAPTVMPSTSAVTIRATSVASPTGANATITLTAPPPPPVTIFVSPAVASVQPGQAQTFSATVGNTSNTAVTWSIVSGSGSISQSGVYTAPASMPPSPAVTIRATSQASSTATATAAITLTPPPPPPVNLSHARFLEQTSFGPTPVTLAEVSQKGFDQFLAGQFAAPETAIPTLANNSMGELRTWWLYNCTTAPDQLRQRMAYSLSQILVTSSTS